MENKDFIIEELHKLPDNKISLFGISCVDRALHLYKYFEKEISMESDDYFSIFKQGHLTLNRLLNKAFNNTLDKYINKDDLSTLSNECLTLAPDTEVLSSTYAVIAQNCAIALSYVFEFFASKNIQFILYCREKVIETIDIISFFKEENEITLNIKFKQEDIIEQEILSLIKQFSDPIKNYDIELIREFDKKNLIQL